MKHLLDIKPEGGKYIYSGYEAFNEEMEIDFKRLWHWPKRFNIDSFSFSLDEKGDPCFEKRYHASGHAPGEDITWVIDQINLTSSRDSTSIWSLRIWSAIIQFRLSGSGT
jgi:ribonuclease J